MLGGDPALALKVLARPQLAGRRESTLFHGVVHAVKKKRNPAAVAFEIGQFQFRMTFADTAADGIGAAIS